MLSGSASVKAARRMLVKLTPVIDILSECDWDKDKLRDWKSERKRDSFRKGERRKEKGRM